MYPGHPGRLPAGGCVALMVSPPSTLRAALQHRTSSSSHSSNRLLHLSSDLRLSLLSIPGPRANCSSLPALHLFPISPLALYIVIPSFSTPDTLEAYDTVSAHCVPPLGPLASCVSIPATHFPHLTTPKILTYPMAPRLSQLRSTSSRPSTAPLPASDPPPSCLEAD